VNHDEMVDLLTLIAARDNRTVGQTTVAVWLEDIGDLAYADAREAVAAHFREEPGVWLMAAHVRQRVKKIRAARLHDFQYVPVPGDENTAVYLAALREQRAAVADGRREPAPALPPGADRSDEVRELCAGAFKRPPREPS
jgi:hypothetical protein